MLKKKGRPRGWPACPTWYNSRMMFICIFVSPIILHAHTKAHVNIYNIHNETFWSIFHSSDAWSIVQRLSPESADGRLYSTHPRVTILRSPNYGDCPQCGHRTFELLLAPAIPATTRQSVLARPGVELSLPTNSILLHQHFINSARSFLISPPYFIYTPAMQFPQYIRRSTPAGNAIYIYAICYLDYTQRSRNIEQSDLLSLYVLTFNFVDILQSFD